ncbi:MAG: hypothetical protein HS111_07420 [Kofleriaceae bacterium]|nr:hypothetical protein [Kofleriaceae bacterium]
MTRRWSGRGRLRARRGAAGRAGARHHHARCRRRRRRGGARAAATARDRSWRGARGARGDRRRRAAARRGRRSRARAAAASAGGARADARLRGTLVGRHGAHIVVDCGGVGYEVTCSATPWPPCRRSSSARHAARLHARASENKIALAAITRPRPRASCSISSSRQERRPVVGDGARSLAGGRDARAHQRCRAHRP